MAYQVLARKWRPRDFGEMVGQEHVVRALVNALDHDRLHHAFLFAGTRGVGKTTLARILAKCLNCTRGISSKPCGECAACRDIDAGRFVDLVEVDAASRTKVDDTRELLDNVQYAPSAGRYKVYLIDEVHMLSNHSFNALLKTLEEPPPHVKFLLATTDPQKLPVTVLSRCLRFNLKRLPTALIADQVMHVLASEAIAGEPAAIKLIARAADGSMRDALSLLDQGIAYGGGRLDLDDMQVMLGTLDATQVYELLHAVATGDGQAMVTVIESLDAKAPDYSAVLDEMAAVIQRVALVQSLPEIAAEYDDAEAVRALAELLSPEDAQLYYQIMLIGKRDLGLAPDPRGGFEMIMLRLLAFRPASCGNSASKKPAPAARPARSTSAPTEPVRDRVAHEGETKPAAIDMAEWDRLVDALALKGMARQLAVNCLFQDRDAQTVTLRIDTAHRELVTEQGVKRLEAALSRYYDAPLRARIEVGGLEAETPAKRDAARHDARLESAREAIAKDPNVRALGKLFDAEVKPESIKPLK